MKAKAIGFTNDQFESIKLLDYGGIDRRFLEEQLGNKDLLITIEEFSAKRTLRQNNWLMGVAYPLIIEFIEQTEGEARTKAEIHAYNMQEVQGYKTKIVNVMGRDVIDFGEMSSSSWSKKQFSEAKEKLQNHFAKKGLMIPDPTSIDYYDDVLYDDSLMPYGLYKDYYMEDVPDDYLIELYTNNSKYCSNRVREYIESINLV